MIYFMEGERMLGVTFANICLFIWYRVVGFPFQLLPIQNNKIVCESFLGKGYSDNPKYIIEKLLENASASLKIIWLVKGEVINDFPQSVQVVKRGSLRELYHLYTAKIWVDNCRKHFGVRKRKGQYYMQTWHGSIGFKKDEKDAKLNIWYRASAKHDSKMADILISSSKWQTEHFKRAYWYDGAILEIGSPRNDFWMEKSTERTTLKRKVCSSLHVDAGKKIVLYAPTFRDSESLWAYDLDYHRLVTVLERYWGDEWLVFVRLHPNLEKDASLIVYDKKVISASHYPDMNQLLLASDLLITDYSSCLFDAVYIEKPSIIYASDLNEYEKTRGFALPITAAPALLSQNNIELENRIREFDLSVYIQKCRKFSKEYGIIHSGDASKKAADWIINRIM